LSQRGSGYDRVHLDRYETPHWVTQCLLGHIVTKPGTLWEPACGNGQMVAVLKGQFLVLGTDIEHTCIDFLKVNELPNPGIRGIITNPPYNLATEFCEHALKLVKPVNGFVAMLLRCDFDHAKTRAHLFGNCPAFEKKIVLTRRIVWFVEDDGKPKASPSFNHAWYVWSHQNEYPPTIAYAP
jgi:hypothetical protein